MDLGKVGELVLKHVDIKGLEKDFAAQVIIPYLEDVVAKVDLIPGTDLDNMALKSGLEMLKKYAEAL